MRRFDKTKNMLNANLLAEQRYLASKGLIKEDKNFGTGEDFSHEDDAMKYGINQYDDEKYDEMQKLKNMSPDMDDDVVADILDTDHFNIMSNVAPYQSIAEYKVNPNPSYEVTEDGLYGVEADVDTTAIRIFDNGREEQVKLPDAHRNAIKKEVEKDIRFGYEMGQNSTYYTVNDSEPEDKGGPESDRAESEYWSNNGLDEEERDTLRDLKAAGVNPNNKDDVEKYLGRKLNDAEYNRMLGRTDDEEEVIIVGRKNGRPMYYNKRTGKSWVG